MERELSLTMLVCKYLPQERASRNLAKPLLAVGEEGEAMVGSMKTLSITFSTISSWPNPPLKWISLDLDQR